MVSLKDLVVNWADRAESALKKGCRLNPPEEVFDYLDLLGRGWGWDRLAPCSGSNEWLAYKKYLKEYYRCNSAESIFQAWQNGKDEGDAVNGNTDRNVLTPRSSLHEQDNCGDGDDDVIDGGILVLLVNLCIKMEDQFVCECVSRRETDQTADHIMLSKEIQERAHALKDTEGEFPVAAAALMFIIKMAELMCEWMRHEAYNPNSEITKVRRYALDLVMYRGSDSDCAAAVLVGISKEAMKICECLRRGTQAETWSKSIMENGYDVLSMLHDEYIFSGNGCGTDATKAGNTTQMNHKKPDCDENSEDMEDVVEIYSEVSPDNMIDLRQLAEQWASTAQASRNIHKDVVLLPPCWIFEHLDLLEKGWGLNRLVPCNGYDNWSLYKKYLEKYYWHNLPKLGAQACLNELTAPGLIGNRGVSHCRKEQEARTSGYVGTGLHLHVRKCVNMEKKFRSEYEQKHVGDDVCGHIILSKEIQECALSLLNLEGEFPVAAASLKCIMRSAELMCEWMRLGNINVKSMVTDVRKYALDLMKYNGSEYYCAAAVMLGIAKETKKICKCLRQGDCITRVRWSKTIMENGWNVLEKLHDGLFCAGNGDGIAAREAGIPPRINTVGELNHKRSDDDNEQEDQDGQMRKGFGEPEKSRMKKCRERRKMLKRATAVEARSGFGEPEKSRMKKCREGKC